MLLLLEQLLLDVADINVVAVVFVGRRALPAVGRHLDDADEAVLGTPIVVIVVVVVGLLLQLLLVKLLAMLLLKLLRIAVDNDAIGRGRSRTAVIVARGRLFLWMVLGYLE